jgi:hypothetical protein
MRYDRRIPNHHLGETYAIFKTRYRAASDDLSEAEAFQLYALEDSIVTSLLSKNPYTPVNVLTRIVDDFIDDFEAFRDLEIHRNYSLPSECVRKIYNAGHNAGYINVRYHPNLPLDIMELEATQKSFYARKDIISNRSTPTHLLEYIYKTYKSDSEKLSIAEHPNVPEYITFEVLQKSEETAFNAILLRSPLTKSLMESLKAIYPLSKLTYASRNKNVPSSFLEELYTLKIDGKKERERLLYDIAANPNVSTKFFERMWSNGDPILPIRVGFIRNPSTPSYILDELVKTPGYENSLVRNPAITNDQLRQIDLSSTSVHNFYDFLKNIDDATMAHLLTSQSPSREMIWIFCMQDCISLETFIQAIRLSKIYAPVTASMLTDENKPISAQFKEYCGIDTSRLPSNMILELLGV